MVKNKGSRQSGFTILELVVAAAMLAVLLTLITQTFVAVERHMRRTDHRAQAMRTVENMLERLLVGSWDEINDEGIRALPLPEDVLKRWPEAKLVGQVAVVAEPVAGKRVTLSLHTGPNARERPVTLTTWIYMARED